MQRSIGDVARLERPLTRSANAKDADFGAHNYEYQTIHSTPASLEQSLAHFVPQTHALWSQPASQRALFNKCLRLLQGDDPSFGAARRATGNPFDDVVDVDLCV